MSALFVLLALQRYENSVPCFPAIPFRMLFVRADLPNDHTYPAGCLRPPHLPSCHFMFGLARYARAYTPTRGIGFYVIWMSISSIQGGPLARLISELVA